MSDDATPPTLPPGVSSPEKPPGGGGSLLRQRLAAAATKKHAADSAALVSDAAITTITAAAVAATPVVAAPPATVITSADSAANQQQQIDTMLAQLKQLTSLVRSLQHDVAVSSVAGGDERRSGARSTISAGMDCDDDDDDSLSSSSGGDAQLEHHLDRLRVQLAADFRECVSELREHVPSANVEAGGSGGGIDEKTQYEPPARRSLAVAERARIRFFFFCLLLFVIVFIAPLLCVSELWQ